LTEDEIVGLAFKAGEQVEIARVEDLRPTEQDVVDG
jgi:hypothetical protein